jgi:hypothetical protein
MNNWDTLADLKKKTLEWNAKYNPDQQHDLIRLYTGERLSKFDLWIEPKKDEAGNENSKVLRVQ